MHSCNSIFFVLIHLLLSIFSVCTVTFLVPFSREEDCLREDLGRFSCLACCLSLSLSLSCSLALSLKLRLLDISSLRRNSGLYFLFSRAQNRQCFSSFFILSWIQPVIFLKWRTLNIIQQNHLVYQMIYTLLANLQEILDGSLLLNGHITYYIGKYLFQRMSYL